MQKINNHCIKLRKYEVTCKDCDAKYMGQTGTRFNKHKRHRNTGALSIVNKYGGKQVLCIKRFNV